MLDENEHSRKEDGRSLHRLLHKAEQQDATVVVDSAAFFSELPPEQSAPPPRRPQQNTPRSTAGGENGAYLPPKRGKILLIVQAILSVLVLVQLWRTQMLPVLYLVVLAALLALLWLLVKRCQEYKTAGTVSRVFSVVLCAAMAMGCVWAQQGLAALGNMTNGFLSNAEANKITKEPFVVYLSGVDTRGDLTDKARSDVNIIAAVNPVTKQVVLINTPRDYYVDLAGTNSKDKLTHAGLYGVQTSMDSEHEMEDECRALGGCFLDYLSGQYRINLLEPRCWDDGSGPEDPDAPDAFRGTLLSQHISFLRDVFRVYKGFDTPHIDTLELMVESLYKKWNITDHTDFASTRPEDYPILSDLYDTIQEAYDNYDAAGLYPREMLRDLLLGLHSMCRGADARFFNGHSNIDRSKFLVFCVKGLDNMAENLRNTLLFSLLSYMSDQLLTLGNSVAAIDELYLWLSDPTVITYIRNALKRVRKKESALFLASQNLEDFTQPGIRELTRPLFSIPVHQFIFNGGNVDKKFFMDNLQLEESEYALIRDPQRGSCLYKCGNERYLLQVQAPEYKQTIFGTAGGR